MSEESRGSTRRTVLRTAGAGAVAVGGLPVVSEVATAGDNDLDTSDDFQDGGTIYFFKHAAYSGTWESHLDTVASNLPECFENHLGTVTVATDYGNNYVSDPDYYDNGASALPDSARGEGVVPFVTVDEAESDTFDGNAPGLGRSYWGPNATAGSTSTT